jgi:AbrB family looped-hinge helix DNA binding protein
VEYVSSVTSKGQVTIPASIRKALGLKPRDKVSFRIEDRTVRIVAAPSSVLESYGSVKLRGGVPTPKRLRKETERWVAEQALRER